MFAAAFRRQAMATSGIANDDGCILVADFNEAKSLSW
jgi:hypothetical protein